MTPLWDITIYYNYTEIPMVYRREFTFISELYHTKMHGYKPPGTGRITISISDNAQQVFEPSYFGSILGFGSYFDTHHFLSFQKKLDRYKFILDFVHNTIIRLAGLLKWDKNVFERSYRESLESNLENVTYYPEKKSRDRKKMAQAILETTESGSILWFKFIINDKERKLKIFERGENFYPLSRSSDIAKSCKWLDNERFGFQYKKTDKVLYFDLRNEAIIKTIKFLEDDYPERKQVILG